MAKVGEWFGRREAARHKRAGKPVTHRHAGKGPKRETTEQSSRAILAELRRNSE